MRSWVLFYYLYSSFISEFTLSTTSSEIVSNLVEKSRNYYFKYRADLIPYSDILGNYVSKALLS